MNSQKGSRNPLTSREKDWMELSRVVFIAILNITFFYLEEKERKKLNPSRSLNFGGSLLH